MRDPKDFDFGFATRHNDESAEAMRSDTLRELITAISVTTDDFPADESGMIPSAYVLGVQVHTDEDENVRLIMHSSGTAEGLLLLSDSMQADLLVSMLRDGITSPDHFTMVMQRLSTILRYSSIPRAVLRSSIEQALRSRPDLYRRAEHGREHDDAQGQAGPSRTLN